MALIALKTDPSQIAPDLITRLGALSLIALPISLLGTYCYVHYRITRASYDASMQQAAGSVSISD